MKNPEQYTQHGHWEYQSHENYGKMGYANLKKNPKPPFQFCEN
jgi:hypothetical protein